MAPCRHFIFLSLIRKCGYEDVNGEIVFAKPIVLRIDFDLGR